ncbi:EAL domain-containing protein [Escherichia coli]|uniref:EAL domain-containing protein n=1 Tax=Escherichia coli TaxID=562 RepID=UPI0012FFC9F3|nr:EAL domain-containing protein [Escherichia coli]EFC3019426.1 EAL domain-containing protein [Escherichia coli]EFE5138898.1 EAL domain-containing protein [Escherichia coli]EGB9066979.1 EAL domain-containing protein [Escherichia coli]EHC2875112.1 EAL domain-containing protein [Escherichia coli]EHH6758057.1 EAL domain-containing protein [Escherichia coli]
MEIKFVAEPIVNMTNNKLMAVEVLSRFYTPNGLQLSTQDTILRLSSAMKINILQKQINAIAEKKLFFIKNNLTCSINVDYDTCFFILKNKNLRQAISDNNFIALEVSERFPYFNENGSIIINNLLKVTGHIWIDDFGSDDCKINMSQLQHVEAIKLDKEFLHRILGKDYSIEILKKISKIYPKIIAEGVETKHIMDKIKDINLWGGQGYYYPSVKLSDIYKLQTYL